MPGFHNPCRLRVRYRAGRNIMTDILAKKGVSVWEKSPRPPKLHLLIYRRNTCLRLTNAGLFHYAGNNPIRYIDPTGAFDWNTNTIEDGDTLSQIAEDCYTKYGVNYTTDDLKDLNKDTISDKDKIYAGTHLNLGKVEEVQRRAADYQSRATTKYPIALITPSSTKKDDHHLRNGLLEISGGVAIWVFTGIEVRNIMKKNPKKASNVGYAGIIAGSTIIADGLTRATGNSTTTVKEDFMSLLNSPLGNAIRELNTPTCGYGRLPGTTFDFKEKEDE